MGLYIDTTGTGTDSGQYAVFQGEIRIGHVFEQNNTWYVQQLGSNTCVKETFKSKQEAGNYLSGLAGINQQKK